MSRTGADRGEVGALTPEAVEAALHTRLTIEVCQFAELLGTLYTLRFTGKVEVDFLNGQPQSASVGRPMLVRFPEHPANRGRDR